MNQSVAADINLNNAECLRTAIDFGAYRIHNVCSGAISQIPWGGVDWLILLGVVGAIVTVIGLFVFMGIAVWSVS